MGISVVGLSLTDVVGVSFFAADLQAKKRSMKKIRNWKLEIGNWGGRIGRLVIFKKLVGE
jgi:hypothetical protein